MQGSILSAASSGNQGVILGDDGIQYTFTPLGWQGYPTQAVEGVRVDFEVRGFHAVGIYPTLGVAPMQPPPAIPTAPIQPAVPRTPVQPPRVPTPTLQYPYAQNSAPPQQPSPSAATPDSRPKVLIGALLAVVIVGIAVAGVFYMLQMQQSQEEIAEAVAREWVNSSIDNISELTMGYLVGNIPVITQAGGDWLADNIRENVTWTYSEPNCRQEGRCDVTATAKADLNINIPLVMNDTASVVMPFRLDINTDEKRVANWDPDIGSASVYGVELGGIGQNIGRTFESSDTEIWRAMESLREFTVDDGVELPGVEFIQFSDDIQEIADRAIQDFDLDRDFEDISDSVDRAIQDFDLDRDFEDISDSVDRVFNDFDTDFGGASDDIRSSFDSLFGE